MKTKTASIAVISLTALLVAFWLGRISSRTSTASSINKPATAVVGNPTDFPPTPRKSQHKPAEAPSLSSEEMVEIVHKFSRFDVSAYEKKQDLSRLENTLASYSDQALSDFISSYRDSGSPIDQYLVNLSFQELIRRNPYKALEAFEKIRGECIDNTMGQIVQGIVAKDSDILFGWISTYDFEGSNRSLALSQAISVLAPLDPDRTLSIIASKKDNDNAIPALRNAISAISYTDPSKAADLAKRYLADDGLDEALNHIKKIAPAK